MAFGVTPYLSLSVSMGSFTHVPLHMPEIGGVLRNQPRVDFVSSSGSVVEYLASLLPGTAGPAPNPVALLTPLIHRKMVL
jgi:hypothetical protein